MAGMDECKPGGKGSSYSGIQDLAGLNLDLPKQDGWLTWSILASLREDGKVESIYQGRRLYWRLN
jgi:hypothetical protein